ncbi:TPR repeat-containing protein, partial [Candidatus Gastranaerophilus sp. (ex Termes propinquus)]
AKSHLTPKDILDATVSARALYNTAQGERALEILEAIPKEHRGEEVWLILANIYEDKGDTARAFDALNSALLVRPGYFRAYYNFGTIYTKKKSYDLAIENFKLSIKHNRDFPYSHYNLGYCYLQKGEWASAKKSFIKAISLKTDGEDIRDFYHNLAYAYKMLGQKKQAEKVLKSIAQ